MPCLEKKFLVRQILHRITPQSPPSIFLSLSPNHKKIPGALKLWVSSLSALNLESLSSQVSQLSTLCLLERARQKFHRGPGVPRRNSKFFFWVCFRADVHKCTPPLFFPLWFLVAEKCAQCKDIVAYLFIEPKIERWRSFYCSLYQKD